MSRKCCAADVEAAVAAARTAFEGDWRKVKPYDLQLLLMRLAQLIEQNFDELYRRIAAAAIGEGATAEADFHYALPLRVSTKSRSSSMSSTTSGRFPPMRDSQVVTGRHLLREAWVLGCRLCVWT